MITYERGRAAVDKLRARGVDWGTICDAAEQNIFRFIRKMENPPEAVQKIVDYAYECRALEVLEGMKDEIQAADWNADPERAPMCAKMDNGFYTLSVKSPPENACVMLENWVDDCVMWCCWWRGDEITQMEKYLPAGWRDEYEKRFEEWAEKQGWWWRDTYGKHTAAQVAQQGWWEGA